MPLAVMNGGRITRMLPVSGGPDAPGLTITIVPIVTGGPGIAAPLLFRRKRSDAINGNRRSLEGGRKAAINRCAQRPFQTGLATTRFQRGIHQRLKADVLTLHRNVAIGL